MQISEALFARKELVNKALSHIKYKKNNSFLIGIDLIKTIKFNVENFVKNL